MEKRVKEIQEMISKIEGEIMAEMEAPRVREQGEEEKRMKNDVYGRGFGWRNRRRCSWK